ncbi:MAG: hypothetical protein V3S39_06445 [Thermodesulfobacteriota bacterium]
MRFIADFHLHSRYSRATSPKMVPEEMAKWAARKGIALLGTGDFTHPVYLAELKSKLLPTDRTARWRRFRNESPAAMGPHRRRCATSWSNARTWSKPSGT